MTGGPKPCLEVRDLVVTFERWGQRVPALAGVSLVVPRGEWLILVGPNGSGKSTLLRAISGRVPCQQGEIHVLGQSVHDRPADGIASLVFLVHQDPLLGTASTLTVQENLAVACDSMHPASSAAGATSWLRRLSAAPHSLGPPEPAPALHAAAEAKRQLGSETRRHRTERFRSLLEPYGLDGRLGQPVRSLSGGERQLLALLIAQLRPAPLVLLDEPVAALDPANAERCLEAIAALSSAGKTLVQVTHDEDHALELGHRTIALRAGQVAYDERGDRRTAEDLAACWYHPRARA